MQPVIEQLQFLWETANDYHAGLILFVLAAYFVYWLLRSKPIE
jgi:hypothetical protein